STSTIPTPIFPSSRRSRGCQKGMGHRAMWHPRERLELGKIGVGIVLVDVDLLSLRAERNNQDWRQRLQWARQKQHSLINSHAPLLDQSGQASTYGRMTNSGLLPPLIP